MLDLRPRRPKPRPASVPRHRCATRFTAVSCEPEGLRFAIKIAEQSAAFHASAPCDRIDADAFHLGEI